MNKFTAILLCIITVFCVGCSDSPADDASNAPSQKIQYQITITDEFDNPVTGVVASIYNPEKTDLCWAGTVSEPNGKFSFSESKYNSFLLELSDIPMGYKYEGPYTITDTNTVIKLKTQLIDPAQAQGFIPKLGTAFVDLSVTDIYGTTHKISELLQTKKAVVLNFWFIGCDPCRMEFPYMQEAYQNYSDKLEILAINPLDGTNESVTAYAIENGLTFPMVASDMSMVNLLNLGSYPTTMVIDKHGLLSFAHSGTITSTETFEKLFRFFCSDNYVPTVLTSLNDLK